MAFRFTWYGHSCVELETAGGKTILFDPWFRNPTSPRAPESVERCDVMLVTHGHHDHLGSAVGAVADADALTIARRTRPVWPCIHELSLWLGHQLGEDGGEIVGMNAGGTVETHGLGISMVPAVHSAGDVDPESGIPLHFGEPVGFVLQLEDAKRVYFAGDTDVFGDMALIREVHRPDVAFLPIGGHYTMGPRQAAIAAGLIGAKVVVPIHYGTFPVLAGTPDQLRGALRERGIDAEILAPQRGTSVEVA